LFLIAKRGGCFAISDQPTIDEVQAASALQGVSAVPVLIAYHMGVRLGLWRACLIMLIPDFFLLR